ncbi:MAG: thiamine phosphate synthase [Desulfuromonadales bacterium]
MTAADYRLYLITDRRQTGGRSLTEVVRPALEGGVRLVQLREKDLTSAELYRLALELRGITSNFGSRLIINDRLDIALATGADGVQVGVNSMPVTEVRRLLGPHMLIGYSAHEIGEARRAQGDGADFVTFGPVYFTPSKSACGQPCGVCKVAEVSSDLDIPVFALGGINPENVLELLDAGVRGIALISSIIAASDPLTATASLLQKIEEHVRYS